jgi:Ni,Fe-hydrogenase I large subunit
VQPVNHAAVAETVARSWYSYSGGDGALLPPYDGQTVPKYTGPKPPYTMINPGANGKYSWLKAPRYDKAAYEVGPLARVLVGYAAQRPAFRAPVDALLASVGITVDKMFSTMGRLAARAIETKIIASQIDGWLAQRQENQRLNNLRVAAPVPPASSWGTVQGYGTTEAPRGALGHWVTIANGVVKNYQMVVPTTWNGSPRDAAGNRGAWETALRGNPLVDPGRPLELLRTVHSFDPCMGCSVHVLDPDGGDPISVVEVV